MHYLFRFPSRKAWLRALKLFLAMLFGASLLIDGFWIFTIASIVSLISLNTPYRFPIPALPATYLATAILCLLAGFSWYLLLGFLWELILKLFWSKPPKWLRPTNSWKEVLGNFTICFFATLPGDLIIFFQEYRFLFSGDIYDDSIVFDAPYQWAAVLSILTLIRLCDWERYWEPQPKKSLRFDKVDMDLNRIKGDMGLHKMKRPKLDDSNS